jgi:hypothetical protein
MFDIGWLKLRWNVPGLTILAVFRNGPSKCRTASFSLIMPALRLTFLPYGGFSMDASIRRIPVLLLLVLRASFPLDSYAQPALGGLQLFQNNVINQSRLLSYIDIYFGLAVLAAVALISLAGTQIKPKHGT